MKLARVLKAISEFVGMLSICGIVFSIIIAIAAATIERLIVLIVCLVCLALIFGSCLLWGFADIIETLHIIADTTKYLTPYVKACTDTTESSARAEEDTGT